MTELYIYIIELGTDDVTEKLGPYDNERQAERAEAGLTRQLDHDRFYSVIVEEESND